MSQNSYVPTFGHQVFARVTTSFSQSTQVSSGRHWLLWILLLVLLVAVTFSPVYWNGFIWDDNMYVTNNPTLHDLDGLKRIWLKPKSTPQYYPMVFTTFWIEHQLWGNRAFGYHVVNLILHALSAILFARLLVALAVAPVAAWTAATLFAAHPITVESVAWVSERKNVLSLTLALASLLAFFAAERRREAARVAGSWSLYVVSLILFLLALLSKTVVATAAPVLLLLAWWRRGRLEMRTLARVGPYFAMGLALGLVTVWMERTHVGASGHEWDLDFGERLIIAGKGVWFYLGKIFWPHPLIFIYPRWPVDSFGAVDYVYPAAVLALIIVLALLGRRIGWMPLVVCLSYLALLFPALGFFDVFPFRYSFVADHFAYHASLAVIAGAVLLVARMRQPRFVPVFGLAVASVVVALFSVLTFNRCRVFADAETVWLDTIRDDKNPQAWIAHNNLGNIAEYRALGMSPGSEFIAPPSQEQSQADFEAAIRHYQDALRWNENDAIIRYNLGRVLLLSGNVTDALPHLERAVQQSPELAMVHHTLGAAKLRLGDNAGGEASLREAARLDPNYAPAQLYLGDLLFRTDRAPEAIAHLEAAVKLRPLVTPWRFLLGDVYHQVGRDEDAVAAYQTALADYPDNADARYLLAESLNRLGRTKEAIEQWRLVIALRPQWVAPVTDLAWTLATTTQASGRDPERALLLAEQARRMTRDQDAHALRSLAAAHASLGDFPSAIRWGQDAVALARQQEKLELAKAIEEDLTHYRVSQPNPGTK